ncbi:hypothetical protein NONO_c55750 [Nocardia nova SH22a]|uniref:Uncharacterized protein n=1 Tax=Nocardia nova SH22a TaxID=1415166 RepID=W5TM13_9NOCA|nr:hypothetical protein [Nocardia nova]AHH20355.1 hypothetical protein NONO_c55750 [Nocardia nova SH22a]
MAKLINSSQWYQIARELALVNPSGEVVQDFTVFFDWSNNDARLEARKRELSDGCR